MSCYGLQRFRHILLGAGVLLILWMATSHEAAASVQERVIRQGVLDLSEWDFEIDGLMTLNGQWELYWDQLLEPDPLDGFIAANDPTYVQVPHVWGQEEQVPDKQGKATYRLTIMLDHEGVQRLKALYIQDAASAYRLWFNGVELDGNGIVGSSRGEMKPKTYAKVIILPVHEGANELVLQVSNYVQRKGGLWSPLLFGNESDISYERDSRIGLQLLAASALGIMAFYHLALFFFRRKDILSLLTWGYCTLMALRTVLLGDTLLVRYQPWLDWEWTVKAEYLSAYVGVPVFTIFTGFLYPKEVNRKLNLLVCVIGAIFSMVVVFTPALVFTYTKVPFELLLIPILLYMIAVLVLAAVRKRGGALLSLMATIIMIATIFHDILYYNHFIHSFDTVPYGVLLFFFVQTLILARKYTKEFRDVENITDELSELNQRLEEKIKERTEALEVANAYLLHANEHLNRLENSRRELIANVTHELGTPMTSIQGYMKALLDGVIQPDKQYIQIIYDKVQMAERLVQDLFDLTKLEEGQTTFHMVDVIVDELFDEYFSIYHWDVESHGISFQLTKPEDQEDKLGIVHIDPIRIRQVMGNLIHNAVHYTEAGGMISIAGRYDKQRLIVEVKDTGKGIDPSIMPFIFDRFFKSNESRKSKYDGSGLGLAIAREIVMHHGGIMTAQSGLGTGSTFQFDIPVEFIPMVVD